MYKGFKVLGVITARGGSKGIPHKNIKKLNGKPLIYYSILSAKRSRYLTYFIVSTDDIFIANVSKKYKAQVPFMRPKHLALDSSRSLDVVKHALRWLKKNKGMDFDYVMILQPTSPLRRALDIDNCIKKAVDTNSDSVMSVIELTDFSIKKLKIIKNDVLWPYLANEGNISQRRQSLGKVFKRNCAIYLTKVNLIKKGDLFGSVSRPYLMPPECSVDINTMADFKLAKLYLKNK